MNSLKMTIAMLGLLTFMAPSTAFCGYYDICGTLRYWDARDANDRDDDSHVTTHTYQTNQPARRVLLYLYDQDGACQDWSPLCGENDDDGLQSTYSNASTGDFCFTDVGDLEDIYYVTTYRSDDTEVLDDSDNHPVSISDTVWNFGSGGDLDKDWNITCSNDIRNSTPGYCDNQTEVDYWFAQNQAYAQILDSAVEVDWLVSPDSLFHLNGHSSRISFHWPEDAGSECDGNDDRIIDCDHICIGENSDDNLYTVAHEAGHAFMKRALDVCGGLADCGGGHSWTSYENEKCATSEGFAHFFGAATFWDRDESGVFWASPNWTMEGWTTQGNSGSASCVSNASSPHRRPGNVARFFWDLYDSTTVGDYWGGNTDNSMIDIDVIIETWDEFSSAEANESGSNGRNVWDFEAHEPWAEQEIYTNCLDSQEAH